MSYNQKKLSVFVSVILYIMICMGVVGLFWSPIPMYEYKANDGNFINDKNVNDIVAKNQCSYSEDGTIQVDDITDPYIIFNKVPKKATYMVIDADGVGKDTYFDIYYDTGEGFSEEQHVQGYYNKGKQFYAFFPKSKVKNVRVDLDQDYKLNGVRFYSGAPIINKHYESTGKLIFGFICASMLCLAVIYFLIKTGFMMKICDMIIQKKRSFVRIGILGICAVLIGGLLSYLLFSIHNMYNMLFMIMLLFNIMIVIYYLKDIYYHFEKAVFFTVLIIGLLMVMIKPYGHAGWDIDSHYKYALGASHIGETKYTQADLDICYNAPYFLAETKDYKQLSEKIQHAIGAGDHYVYSSKTGTTIAHIPYGMMISFLRLIGCNIFYVYIFGRIPSVIIYSICVYCGIKKLKCGKLMYASVAMIPTVLFMAADYSYDYWVIAFLMLGIAYFISALQNKNEKICKKDIIIMSFSLAIACLPKQVYLPLCLIPFLMPWNKMENKKKYYQICMLALSIIVISFLYRSFFEVTGSGDIRGGAVNPSEQIMFIISNPLHYFNILISFLKGYFPPINLEGISYMAYLGFIKGGKICCLLILLMAIFDKGEVDSKAYPVYLRICIVAISIGIVVMCATALYIAYTPVGENTIAGCQPRYVLPVIYPLAAVIFGRGINIKPLNKLIIRDALAVCVVGIYMIILYLGIYDQILIG